MPWKVPDKAFLSFEDAAACRDFGDLSAMEFDSISIVQLPFLCMTKDENRIGKKSYPATESRIDSFLSAKLKPRFKLIAMSNGDSLKGTLVNDFIEAVLTKAANGKGNPLQWGGVFPPDLIGSRTIVYFPFGIERESGEYVRARFFVLIFDPIGNVLFSRCMAYHPEEWSADFNIFKSEVQGNLPLLEH
jgi:hypothetical protein